MNKYQKELIDKCEPYPVGTPFDVLYIIPSGVSYNGFWGKNGYNKIYLVCRDTKNDKWYIVGDEYECDVLSFNNHSNYKDVPALRADIPNKLNCLCVVGKRRLVFNVILSNMTLEDCE